MKSQGFVRIFTIFALTLLLSKNSEGRGLFYPSQRYESARSLAMSGAALTQSTEIAYSLANNPANLSMLQSFHAEIANLSLETTAGTINAAGDGAITSTSLKGMKKALDNNENEMIGGGFGIFPVLAWKGVSFGVLMQERVRAINDGTNYKSELVSQTIPMLGFGIPLARGIMRLGYTLQYVNQSSGTKSTAVGTPDLNFNGGMNEGRGLSHNASVGWVLPFTYLPSLAVTARNIGGLHFTSGSLFSRANNVAGVPTDEDMTIDAGFSIAPRIAGRLKTVWSIQFKDALMASDLGIMDHFSAGMEINLWNTLQLRAGYSGILDFSLGLGYETKDSTINFSWFHEKNSTGLGGTQDSRYMIQYTFRIGQPPIRDKNKDVQK